MSTTDLIIGTLLGTYTTMTQKITKDPGGTNTLIYDGPITPTATGDIEITMQPSWGDGNYEIEITATDSSTGITDTEVLNINVIFGTSTVTTGISGTPTTSNTSPLLVDFSATTNDSLSIGMLDGIGIINYEIHDDSKSPTLQDSGIVYETPDGEIEIPFDSTLGNGVYRLEIDVQDTSGTSIATETIYVNITF
jgi:hypothetical protein